MNFSPRMFLLPYAASRVRTLIHGHCKSWQPLKAISPTNVSDSAIPITNGSKMKSRFLLTSQDLSISIHLLMTLYGAMHSLRNTLSTSQKGVEMSCFYTSQLLMSAVTNPDLCLKNYHRRMNSMQRIIASRRVSIFQRHFRKKLKAYYL